MRAGLSAKSFSDLSTVPDKSEKGYRFYPYCGISPTHKFKHFLFFLLLFSKSANGIYAITAPKTNKFSTNSN